MRLNGNFDRDVDQIAEPYQLSLFSETQPGQAQAKQAAQAWSRLRWQLWWARWNKPKA
jgi:hypothetical protein